MSQDKECSNPGYENKFTCPACYTDFEGVSTTRCPGCATTLHCHRET